MIWWDEWNEIDIETDLFAVITDYSLLVLTSSLPTLNDSKLGMCELKLCVSLCGFWSWVVSGFVSGFNFELYYDMCCCDLYMMWWYEWNEIDIEIDLFAVITDYSLLVLTSSLPTLNDSKLYVCWIEIVCMLLWVLWLVVFLPSRLRLLLSFCQVGWDFDILLPSRLGI